jgi:hypothetical protein
MEISYGKSRYSSPKGCILPAKICDVEVKVIPLGYTKIKLRRLKCFRGEVERHFAGIRMEDG